MSSYTAPREILPIFNTSDWEDGADVTLTQADADARYLRLNGGDEKGSVEFMKNVTIDGTLGVTGNTSMSNTEITYKLTGNTATFSGNVAVDTNVLYVDTTNNRVGINNGSANVDLDVTGIQKITYNSNTSTGLVVQNSITTGDTTGKCICQFLNGNNNNNNDKTNMLLGTGAGAGNATRLFFNYVGNSNTGNYWGISSSGGGGYIVGKYGGNIGINNTTCAYPLDITGNTNISSGSSYKINGTDVLNSNTLGSGILNSSLTSVGTLGTLSVTGNTSVGTDDLYVDTVTHRVGVNDTTPSYDLDVNGTFRTTGVASFDSLIRTSYGALPTYTSDDIGYTVLGSGTNLAWTGSGDVLNIGGSVKTLTPGMWLLCGFAKFDNTSSTTSLVQVTAGWSTGANTWSGIGDAITEYHVINNTSTKSISYGNAETYPTIGVSEVISVSSNRNCYFTGQAYYTGSTPRSATSYYTATRIG